MNRDLELEFGLGQAVVGRRLKVRVSARAGRRPITLSGLTLACARVVRSAHPSALASKVLWAASEELVGSSELQAHDEYLTIEPGEQESWEVALAAPRAPSVKALWPTAFEVEYRLQVTGRSNRQSHVQATTYVTVGSPRSLHSDVEGRVERLDEKVPIKMLCAHAQPGGSISVLVPDGMRVALLRRELTGCADEGGKPLVRYRRYDTTHSVSGKPIQLGVPSGATPTAVHPEGEIRWFVEARHGLRARTRVEVNIHTC